MVLKSTWVDGETYTAVDINAVATAVNANATAIVAASDADLTTIAALTPANDDIIQRKSGAWTNRTIAQVKADLGSGSGQLNVKDYGAVGNGTTNDTAAIQAAINALPTSTGSYGGGAIYVPPGTYKITNTLAFKENQSMFGAHENSVKLDFQGTGIAIAATGTAGGVPDSNGRFENFSVFGYGGTSVIGMQVRNMQGTRVNNVTFAGCASIALKFYNTSTSEWSENNHVDITTIQCGLAIDFDGQSSDWSTYRIHIVGDPGNSGIRMQNHAVLSGCRIEMLGDIKAKATSNAAYAFAIDPGNTAGDSWVEGCEFLIALETGGAGGTIGPYTILLGSTAGTPFSGTGMLWFKDYGTPIWQGFSTAGGAANFLGYWRDEVLGKTDPFACQGAAFGTSQERSLGFSAYNNMYIYPNLGGVKAFILPNGAINISGFWEEANFKRAHTLDIFFKQPASGAAGTITWPSNVKWAGGTSTLSSVNGRVDKVTLTYLPTETKWYGEVYLNYS